MKRIRLLLTALIMTMAMGLTAFAGQWKSTDSGWQYDTGNGECYRDGWQWIDGNQDGIAESYYFDSLGYCLMNTTTPDGYTVDSNGAWIVDGIIQTKALSETVPAPAPAPTNSSAPAKDTSSVAQSVDSQNVPAVSSTVYLPATGEKYHKIPNCGRMNAAKARAVTVDEAVRRGYEPCSKCY